MSPAVEAWSPNHWTAREFPLVNLISIIMAVIIVSVILSVHVKPSSGSDPGEAWQGVEVGGRVKGPSCSILCSSQEFSKFS